MNLAEKGSLNAFLVPCFMVNLGTNSTKSLLTDFIIICEINCSLRMPFNSSEFMRNYEIYKMITSIKQEIFLVWFVPKCGVRIRFKASTFFFCLDKVDGFLHQFELLRIQ